MSMSVAPYRFATVSSDGVQWMLKRNCSITPRQMGVCFLALSALSLSVAVFFWTQGATLVLPFAALELLAVGVAFLLHARHATDHVRISVAGGRLQVLRESAGKTEAEVFPADWVRVETGDHRQSLIGLCAAGRSVWVGRHVRPDQRAALAREIRQALQALQMRPAT